MIVSRLSLAAFLLLTLALLIGPAAAQTGKASEPQIIERVIKIEGTVERPRVLFIIPRARIWKEDPLKKSFYDDILKPVYPETFLRDFTRYESSNHIRR